MTDYKSAGVDIDAVNKTLNSLKPTIEQTFSTAVLNPLGGFAALYDLKNLLQEYTHPILVQSVDGIGTKMMIARMMNQYHTLGVDLVSATSNDLLVYGAKPLTLLDYVAGEKLEHEALSAIIQGIAQACQQHRIALVGGECAEMPGIYRQGEYDVAAMISGVVEKEELITGQNINPGDQVLAFSSSGLHSNGYSLARHVLLPHWNIDSIVPELQQVLGTVLLEPHRNYLPAVHHLLQQKIAIKGMVHITGGGIWENIPRILPQHCAVNIQRNSWPQQALFSLIQDIGHINEYEMYRTFNMGIGYLLIGDEHLLETANKALHSCPEFKLYAIGQVVHGNKEVRLCA